MFGFLFDGLRRGAARAMALGIVEGTARGIAAVTGKMVAVSDEQMALIEDGTIELPQAKPTTNGQAKLKQKSAATRRKATVRK